MNNTNNDLTITPNMNLGIQSPSEDVMEENVTEKAKSKCQHIVKINESTLRRIIKETIINYLK